MNGEAAIHRQVDLGDEGGGVAREEEGGMGDVVGMAEPADRIALYGIVRLTLASRNDAGRPDW